MVTFQFSARMPSARAIATNSGMKLDPVWKSIDPPQKGMLVAISWSRVIGFVFSQRRERLARNQSFSTTRPHEEISCVFWLSSFHVRREPSVNAEMEMVEGCVQRPTSLLGRLYNELDLHITRHEPMSSNEASVLGVSGGVMALWTSFKPTELRMAFSCCNLCVS